MDPDQGLFAADSVTRRINREQALLVGGGCALLLQVAHPLVAAGVADHSDFRRDPFKRLQGTLDAMMTVVYGTEEHARQMAAILERVHSRVVGPGYSAYDPELLWWVYATLIDTALRIHRRFLRPLSDDEAREFYADSLVVAEMLGVPRSVPPTTLVGFNAYIRYMVGTLTVSDTARELGHAVLHPAALPRFTEPALELVRQVTAGLTPRPLREQYGLGWDAPRKAALLAVGAASRSVLSRVPTPLRRFPAAA